MLYTNIALNIGAIKNAEGLDNNATRIGFSQLCLQNNIQVKMNKTQKGLTF